MEGRCGGKELGAKGGIGKMDAPGGVKDEDGLLKTAEGGFELGVLVCAMLLETVVLALEGFILAAEGVRAPAMALVLNAEGREENQDEDAKKRGGHGETGL